VFSFFSFFVLDFVLFFHTYYSFINLTNNIVVDCTFGFGGHSNFIFEQMKEDELLIGIE